MDIDKMMEESFEEYWSCDEPWKKEEHKEVFKQGFAAGIANLLACQDPIIKELREEIKNLIEFKREDNSE